MRTILSVILLVITFPALAQNQLTLRHGDTASSGSNAPSPYMVYYNTQTQGLWVTNPANPTQSLPIVQNTSNLTAATATIYGRGLFVNTAENYTRVQIAKYVSGSGHSNAPTWGTIGAQYLQLGGLEYGANTVRGIGFGYAAGTQQSPGFMGYQEKNTAGGTNGDLFFATRGDTGSGAPSERLRITAAGDLVVATAYTPANPNSLSTKAYVDSNVISYGSTVTDKTQLEFSRAYIYSGTITDGAYLPACTVRGNLAIGALASGGKVSIKPSSGDVIQTLAASNQTSVSISAAKFILAYCNGSKGWLVLSN